MYFACLIILLRAWKRCLFLWADSAQDWKTCCRCHGRDGRPMHCGPLCAQGSCQFFVGLLDCITHLREIMIDLFPSDDCRFCVTEELLLWLLNKGHKSYWRWWGCNWHWWKDASLHQAASQMFNVTACWWKWPLKVVDIGKTLLDLKFLISLLLDVHLIIWRIPRFWMMFVSLVKLKTVKYKA